MYPRHSHQHQFAYLGHDDVIDRLVFVPEQDLLCRDQDQIRELLRQISRDQNLLPVLALDNNPHPASYLQNLLDLDIDVKYFVLLPDFAWDIKVEHAHAWPGLLINQQTTENAAFDVDREPRYRISFLSGRMRYHRLLLGRLMQTHVQDQDLVIINGLGKESYNKTVPMDGEDLGEFIAKLPWSNHAEDIDVDQSSSMASDILSIDRNPAYDACVNITGESDPTDGRVFLTEKTWKAYWAGCLVINYGADIVPDWLRLQGFGIVDSIDPVCDFQAKAGTIARIMREIDLRDLYHETVELRLHNQNRVRSRDWARSLAKPTIGKIKSLL